MLSPIIRTTKVLTILSHTLAFLLACLAVLSGSLVSHPVTMGVAAALLISCHNTIINLLYTQSTFPGPYVLPTHSLALSHTPTHRTLALQFLRETMGETPRECVETHSSIQE